MGDTNKPPRPPDDTLTPLKEALARALARAIVREIRSEEATTSLVRRRLRRASRRICRPPHPHRSGASTALAILADRAVADPDERGITELEGQVLKLLTDGYCGRGYTAADDDRAEPPQARDER